MHTPQKFPSVLMLTGLAGLLVAHPAQAQNIVLNPGFETGTFAGWTNSTSSNVTIGAGQFVHSGTYSAEIGTVGIDDLLSQTLTTVVGQTYNISFWLVRDYGTPNDFSVKFGNDTLFSQVNGPQIPYTQFSFTDVATSTSTSLSFAARQDPGEIGLDDISVTPRASAVPESGSLSLLGLGLVPLGGILMAARRRRNA